LQDASTGVFGPVFSVSVCWFVHRRDASPDRFSNSRGGVSASAGGHPDGRPGSPDLGASFPFASGLSWPVGTQDGYSTPGSLPGDLEEKKSGNADIVSGSWLPSRGNHKSVSGSLKRKKIKKWGMVWEKGRK
jgi:hypothetical protein